MRSTESTSAAGRSSTPSGLRALVVEDEVDLAGLIGSYLEHDGFEVTLAHDGLAAVGIAREVDPDVVVLDLGLPSLDGVEVCRRIRTFSDCYVVMLTARADEVDTLIGLSVGADDYMTKPFSPRELIARITAMLRRPRPSTSTPDGPGGRSFGALTIDTHGRDVWLDGEPVPLTRTEFDVLAALPERPGMAFHGAGSSNGCGARPGWATSTSSTCTSATCAANSATTPPRADTYAPFEGSATGWAPADERRGRAAGRGGPAPRRRLRDPLSVTV